MLINIISEISSELWERELRFYSPESKKFIFSHSPVEADIHVIYGSTKSFPTAHNKNRLFFVTTEPPEIKKYHSKFLKQFGLVIGPRFDSKTIVRRHIFPPLLPSHNGVNFQLKGYQILSELEICEIPFSARQKAISVITSGKKITAAQRWRLQLVKELKAAMGRNLVVFGRDSERIQDKYQVLTKYSHHLALENSFHMDYWSEKLTDPILAGAKIYYAGAPNVNDYFLSQSCKLLLPYDISSNVQMIMDDFSQSDPGVDRAIKKNQQLLTNEFNLFRVLEVLAHECLTLESSMQFGVTGQNERWNEFKLLLKSRLPH